MEYQGEPDQYDFDQELNFVSENYAEVISQVRSYNTAVDIRHMLQSELEDFERRYPPPTMPFNVGYQVGLAKAMALIEGFCKK